MYAIHPTKMTGNQVCVKEVVNGYEISAAFDDSCGCMPDCSRGDIRIYNAIDEDITDQVMPGISVIVADIRNFTKVYNWCMKH
jgi:hypothetical protein